VSAEREWVHAGEGEEVVLVCKVYANPPPRVSWYKNTMRLIEGERTHLQVQDHDNLLMGSVYFFHFLTWYVCTARFEN
jgi:Immunoglobulin domain